MVAKKSSRTTATAQQKLAALGAELLAQTYPDAHCALEYRNPFELLVATVLSAQTTDKRVNTVTPELFAKYPTSEAMAAAPIEELARITRVLGFQNKRAQQLKELSHALVVNFGTEIPVDRAALETLPGVGRKTAHVVLGNAFGIPAITVDTHVGRVATRLGWSQAKTPLAIEKDIAALLPNYDWTILCHRMIEHGRNICHARTPQCGKCPLADICPSEETH
ncbi:endonuclease III [Gleimia sp. 6138-11-ORH1]|uniref:endonuclease III n=1 Tax=Gleimia sp. 6138-11-ORH1 TaxID=2973937 RepID=UPI00216993E1|nr:endonuclease III [Gleimia sp. 6138-11-ORH1]MCS4484741.1 endonuclease III [Gleimia sp. 6138-11-ORH1]